MERLLRFGVAAFVAALLGGEAVHASKCHAVLPSMVPRNMLRGEWKAVLTDVEPLLKSKVTTFDNLVWTSKSISAEAELISCASKCLQTIYHEYGLHDAGLRIANTSLLWVWRVHGPKVLQDQYMAVKLRHMPSAEALKPLVDVLGEEHWPPGSDFTIHVLVHLLHDYMSHSKQARGRIRSRLSSVSTALEQTSPQHASLLRFARDCTTLVDRTPGNPTKQLIAKMRSTRSVSQAAYFRARQALVAVMLGLDIHKAAVMVGMDPDSAAVQALRAMTRHSFDTVVPHGCPGQSGCIHALQQVENDAAAKLSASVGRVSVGRSEASIASSSAAEASSTGAQGGWYQGVEDVGEPLHPIAGQRREHDSTAIGGYPVEGSIISSPSSLNRPPPSAAPERAADKAKETVSEQERSRRRSDTASLSSRLLNALPPAAWMVVGCFLLAAVLLVVQKAADADLQKRSAAVSHKVATITGPGKKQKRKTRGGSQPSTPAANASPKVGPKARSAKGGKATAAAQKAKKTTDKPAKATSKPIAAATKAQQPKASPAAAAASAATPPSPLVRAAAQSQDSPALSSMPKKGASTPKRKGKTARRRRRQNSINSAASERSSVAGTPVPSTPQAVPEADSPGELSLEESAVEAKAPTAIHNIPQGGAAGSADGGNSLLSTMRGDRQATIDDTAATDSGGWETVAAGGRHSKAASAELDVSSAAGLDHGVELGAEKPASEPQQAGVAESKGSHFVPRTSSSSAVSTAASKSSTASNSRQSSLQASARHSRQASSSSVDVSDGLPAAASSAASTAHPASVTLDAQAATLKPPVKAAVGPNEGGGQKTAAAADKHAQFTEHAARKAKQNAGKHAAAATNVPVSTKPAARKAPSEAPAAATKQKEVTTKTATTKVPKAKGGATKPANSAAAAREKTQEATGIAKSNQKQGTADSENSAALRNLLAQAASSLTASSSASARSDAAASSSVAHTHSSPHAAVPTDAKLGDKTGAAVPTQGAQRGLLPDPAPTAADSSSRGQSQSHAHGLETAAPSSSLGSMDGVVAVSADSSSTSSCSPPPTSVSTFASAAGATGGPVPIAALPVPASQPQRMLMLYQDHIYCMQSGDFGVGWYRIGTSSDKALLAEYVAQQQQAQAVAQQQNMLQAASAQSLMGMQGGSELASGTWPHSNPSGALTLPGAVASNSQPSKQSDSQHGTPAKQPGSRNALSPSGPINIPLPGGATLNIGLSTVASSSSMDSRPTAVSTAPSINTSGPMVPPPRISSSSSMRSVGRSPTMSASAAAAATLHAAMTRGQYSISTNNSPAHYATHGMSAHSMASPMHLYQQHMQASTAQAQAQAAASLQRSHSGHMLHAAGIQAQAMHAQAVQHAAQMDAAIAAAGEGEMRTARGNSVASDMSRRSSTGSRGGTSVSKVTKKVIGLLPVPTDPRQMSMSTGPYGPPRVPRQEAVPPRAAYAPQGDMQQVYQSSRGAQESVRPQSMLPHMNSPFVMKQNGNGQPAAASSRPQGSSKPSHHSRRGRQKATSSHKVH